MIPLVGFCGASGSGKTTLVCRVIAELTRRGLAVGAVKHHGHPEPLRASAGPKDSDRLAQAGAVRVALVHAGGVWLFAPPEEAQAGPAQVAAGFMPGVDLVLVEGFKRAEIPKIEVVAPGREPLLPPGGRLLALARRGGGGGADREAGLVVLDADDAAQVADFVLAHCAAGVLTGGSKVSLAVDGKKLELNPFVGRLLEATLRGMVQNLKGGAGARSIEVKISG